MMRPLRRRPDPFTERNRRIADARESLRRAHIDLIHAQVAVDKIGDEAFGDDLYDLSHTLYHKVMVKLLDLQKGLS
jgi:hypothetical protein